MNTVTVADILRMHGKWIEANQFTKLISEKLNIKDRQAWRKIKKATKKGEVMRLPLSNRRVLYGLAEFGLPDFPYEKLTTSDKPSFEDGEAMAISGLLLSDKRYFKNYAQLYIWLKRGAKPEERPELVK